MTSPAVIRTVVYIFKFIHVSELSREKIESPRDFAKPGDTLEAVVLNIDTVDRKIAMSIKQLEDHKEKAEVREFLGAQKEATSNSVTCCRGPWGATVPTIADF